MRDIDIEEAKCIQLDIMQDIHDFCTRHGLRYTLGYGALLGAVRHGGFIPWDDDIDILMLREDYERFIATYNDGHSECLRVHSLRNDNEYGLPFAKVEDKRTLSVEKGANKPLGVSVDIFPVDPLYPTLEESEACMDRLNLIRTIYRGRMLRPTPLNSKAKRIAIRILNFLTAPFSLHGLAQWYEQKCRCGIPGAAYVAVTVSGYGRREILPAGIFADYTPIRFEDREFIAVSDTDAYLSRVYGDYMTPPPSDKRHSPHTHISIHWIDE